MGFPPHLLKDVRSTDRDAQNAAYTALMAQTDQPVDWAYAAWDELLEMLRDQDNHQRAIGAQVLCNLAKSDPELRIVDAIPALLAVTRDERFVTARHCLQSLWKIGVAGPRQQQMVVAGLAERFAQCGTEKNGTLIRYDIEQALRNIDDASGDTAVRDQALALIPTEPDPKYRKKYAGVWSKQSVD